jgi:hypothetical protein
VFLLMVDVAAEDSHRWLQYTIGNAELAPLISRGGR